MRAVLIGAGGHARAIVEATRGGGALELVACTDPRPELHGTTVDGVAVIGGDERLETLLADGVRTAVLGVGAVGDNTRRAELFDDVEARGFAFPPVVSARAAVAQTATVGAGCVVLAMAVVGPGAVLGRNVIVNTGAIVEHDVVIGDHAHVASGATLGGAVTVEARAHVGLGAVVRQGQRLGAGCLVAAGAVVVADVPAGATVMGRAAREVSS